MSADTLKRAAAKLREHVEAATPGPWAAENVYRLLPGCRCLSCDEDEPYGKAIHEIDAVGEDASPTLKPGDADYIVLMHPPVALALADWLERYAQIWTTDQHSEYYADAPQALVVARAILREATDGVQ
jgi:hypothetical protein